MESKVSVTFEHAVNKKSPSGPHKISEEIANAEQPARIQRAGCDKVLTSVFMRTPGPVLLGIDEHRSGRCIIAYVEAQHVAQLCQLEIGAAAEYHDCRKQYRQ